jgi:hypothetical protein
MTRTKIRFLRIALAAVAGAGCLFASDRIASIQSGSLVTQARAIIGRPLTPMSYAGVARRTTVGVGVGVAVAAPVVVVPGAVVVAPACAQVVNAYGQLTTVCR